MKTAPLRSSVLASILLCLSLSAFSQQTTTYDPLAAFLQSKGFANIPYIKQNQAKIGAVVAAPKAGGIPIFEVPAKATPTAEPNPGIEMPGEVISQIQAAGLGLKIFGFDSGADFNKPESLNYKTVILTGPQLNIDQVRALLKDSETTSKLDYYKGDLTLFRKNQKFYDDLYIISGVFYSTGVDIVSTSGTEVSLRTNETVPACPTLPAPDTTKPTDATKPADTSKPADPAKPAGTTKPAATNKPTGTAKPTAAATSASGLTNDVKTVTDATDKVSADATNTAKAATNVATTAASAGIPGGYGHYCRKISGEVHFSSDRPIPVGMEVYVALWNGSGYEALSPTKTPQFANK